ncbi:hypothetical protein GCM10018790_65740 [Kitasatospora xanthocidica]|uniref:DUF2278 family protein n=1 Tax=Kitasatospora xanthocidica TaxID=83382 RepID=UPI001675A396|nr:DUF2278 family protein [Kitasatospora xanthocidica]GHF78592.1 hypothetical protein GCM10018790_65740 [Kitasatospora xanthocidica]
MPLINYGVLAARVVESKREAGNSTPHYQIHVRDDGGVDYRIAVNVRSQGTPPNLLYAAIDDFHHPLTQLLPPTGSGWHPEPSRPGTVSLDFIRGNLFDPATMRVLPPDVPGLDNDLEDLLDHYVQRAIADQSIGLYVFGQRWPTDASDKVFGFHPGNGVHDIHMNQGNDAGHAGDDGVWQDGGLLLHVAPENRWVAIFLAFQSQAWHTDDTTGHALAPTRPTTPHQEPVRISAALVNPLAPATGTVTVVNTSAAPINLQGWHLTDQQNLLPLPDTELQPGASATLPVANGFRLGEDGGVITLLDPAGLKVHGVAYTGRQASAPGQTLTF